MAFLKKLNSVAKFSSKQTIKIKDLEENKQFEILNVRRTKNIYNKKYGAIQLETKDFITYLPDKYAKEIDDKDIKEMNKNKYLFSITLEDYKDSKFVCVTFSENDESDDGKKKSKKSNTKTEKKVDKKKSKKNENESDLEREESNEDSESDEENWKENIYEIIIL